MTEVIIAQICYKYYGSIGKECQMMTINTHKLQIYICKATPNVEVTNLVSLTIVI